MKYGSICPVCGKNCQCIALTKLVLTFEPSNNNELIETTWHKKCYLSSQLKKDNKDNS